ncbi:MAG: DoxX family membrane protein [Phycisphaerales bacterium]|nr:DoxX family membrane protein [Phycisphaerales bacterium]
MTASRTIGGVVLLLLRLVTAGLFIWAASVKFADVRTFRQSIKGFHLLPEHILDPLAFLVPWTELVCAVALILGLWARSAALVIAGMLAMFAAAVASALLRPEIHVECGCFGKYTLLCPPGEVGWCNVGQNALLLAIVLPVILWGPGILSLDRWGGRGRTRAPLMDSTPPTS